MIGEESKKFTNIADKSSVKNQENDRAPELAYLLVVDVVQVDLSNIA